MSNIDDDDVNRLEKLKYGKDLLNKFKNRRNRQSSSGSISDAKSISDGFSPSNEEGYISMAKHSPQPETSIPSDLSDSSNDEPHEIKTKSISDNGDQPDVRSKEILLTENSAGKLFIPNAQQTLVATMQRDAESLKTENEILRSQLKQSSQALSVNSDKLKHFEELINTAEAKYLQQLQSLQRELDLKREECEKFYQFQVGDDEQKTSLMDQLRVKSSELQSTQEAARKNELALQIRIDKLSVDLQTSRAEVDRLTQVLAAERQIGASQLREMTANFETKTDLLRREIQERESELLQTAQAVDLKYAETHRLEKEIKSLKAVNEAKQLSDAEQYAAATTQLRLSNERCQQLEEMISKLESRQSNQSKSEIESLIERIKQLESELEKQRFSHDSELKITNERCLELTERLRESEKQNSVLKSVPQTAENWRQRFEDSCVKITALVKEQRELRAQLEKAQRNHKQEQQKMTPNQELLLDELEIDNETLKKRNEALVKLVAKLTSLSWDQDNIIQKLKRDVNAGDTNGASNPRSSNNAHKSAGKQSIAWTIPIDQIDRK